MRRKSKKAFLNTADEKELKETCKAFVLSEKSLNKFKKSHYSRFRIALFSLTEFLFLGLGLLLSWFLIVLIAYCVDLLTGAVSEEVLRQASPIVNGALSALFAASVLPVVFSSGSENDLFNKNNHRLFFSTCSRIRIENSTLLLYSVTYTLFEWLAFIVGLHKYSIAFGLMSLVFTIFLCIGFFKFKGQSQQDNFIAYLKTTGRLKKPKKSLLLREWLSLSKPKSSKEIDKIVNAKAKEFAVYGTLLQTAIDKNEAGTGVLSEQNIIETILASHAKAARSPFDVLWVTVLCSHYYKEAVDCFSKCPNAKQLQATTKRVTSIVSVCYDKAKEIVEARPIEYSKLPTNYLLLHFNYGQRRVFKFRSKLRTAIQAYGAAGCVLKVAAETMDEIMNNVIKVSSSVENNQLKNGIISLKETDFLKEYLDYATKSEETLEKELLKLERLFCLPFMATEETIF